MSTKLAAANRCNSAVTTRPIESQESPQKPPATGAAQKNYRTSLMSRTVRVPNELLPRVSKLIAEYRAKQRDDPDSY